VPGKAAWLAAGLPSEGLLGDASRAGAVAHRDVPTCRPDETVGDLAERMEGWEACVVTSEEGVVLGLVRREALGVPAGTPVERALQPGPPSVRPSIPVEELAASMQEDHEERVLVTTFTGRLVGLVRLEDLHGQH
jgi:CBS domain-containing protein